MAENNITAEAKNGQTFTIQKIYIKDVSFETPNSPDVFKGKDFQPDINLQLQSRSRALDEHIFEIVLVITVTAKVNKDSTAYLVEVEQAGIFNLDGFSDEDMTYMIGSYCPNILFPYAREVISDLVTKGGFPQLLLAPVNFDALLTQQLQQQDSGDNEATQ